MEPLRWGLRPAGRGDAGDATGAVATSDAVDVAVVVAAAVAACCLDCGVRNTSRAVFARLRRRVEAVLAGDCRSF